MLHTLQGAYRHGRSADQILMYAVDTIVQAVDAGDCVCAAFLNLRKAFDSLDHCILLGRLQKLGVTRNWKSQVLNLDGLLIISVVVCSV